MSREFSESLCFFQFLREEEKTMKAKKANEGFMLRFIKLWLKRQQNAKNF
jgi:hypothetical protein